MKGFKMKWIGSKRALTGFIGLFVCQCAVGQAIDTKEMKIKPTNDVPVQTFVTKWSGQHHRLNIEVLSPSEGLQAKSISPDAGMWKKTDLGGNKYQFDYADALAGKDSSQEFLFKLIPRKAPSANGSGGGGEGQTYKGQSQQIQIFAYAPDNGAKVEPPSAEGEKYYVVISPTQSGSKTKIEVVFNRKEMNEAQIGNTTLTLQVPDTLIVEDENGIKITKVPLKSDNALMPLLQSAKSLVFYVYPKDPAQPLTEAAEIKYVVNDSSGNEEDDALTLLPVVLWDVNDLVKKDDDIQIEPLEKLPSWTGSSSVGKSSKKEDIKILQRLLVKALDGRELTSPPYPQSVVTEHKYAKYWYGRNWRVFTESDVNGVYDQKTATAVVRVQKMFELQESNIGTGGNMMDLLTGNGFKDKSVAWIDPHTSETDPAPRMPQLELRLGGNHHKVVAKLEVVYKRGNNETRFTYIDGNKKFQPLDRNTPEDTVNIPSSGYTEVKNGVWKVYEEAQWKKELNNNGFFGGNATLHYQVLNAKGEEVFKDVLYFRIGGENPDDEKCKAFITGTVGDSYKRFAYAIAKHETNAKNGNGVGLYYSQFARRPRYVNKNGLPIYNFDYSLGPGGYGLFQITGDAESNLINIPRKQIWNWQDNVRAVVPILDAKKHRQEVSVIHFGVPLRGDYRFKNKKLTKEAWGIIVNYNGNSGNPYHRAVKYGVPWYYRGNQWRFYDNKQHYAEQVAGHLD